jgi:hypothetical protein
MAASKARKSSGSAARLPSCFVSYSTREPTGSLLTVLVWEVFHSEYRVRLTPSALTSGEGQLRQIEEQISECQFAVVCLDGLRPNVIHEWGYMRGHNKPTIVLNRDGATVDIVSILGPSAPANMSNPALVMDMHLSNLKDINRQTWYPGDPVRSARVIWEEYRKLKENFSFLVAVKEPKLW